MQKNLEHKKLEEKFSSNFYTTTVDIEPNSSVRCFFIIESPFDFNVIIGHDNTRNEALHNIKDLNFKNES